MRKTFILLLCLEISICSLFAVEGVLTQSFNARAVGMGEAFCAEAGDLSVLHYNIAGLAKLKSREMQFQFQQGIAEDSFGVFDFGLPLEKSVISAGIMYYDAGKLELIDKYGTIHKTVNGQRDVLFHAGYSREKFSWFVMNMISYGMRIKVLQSKLIEEFSAVAYAVDLGLLYRGLTHSYGFSLQNLGSTMSYAAEKHSLPQNMRLGYSYEMERMRINADYVILDTESGLHIGVEYAALDLLTLRAGYKAGYDLDNLTFGFGFKKSDNLELDYGILFMQEMGFRHLFSLKYRFLD